MADILKYFEKYFKRFLIIPVLLISLGNLINFVEAEEDTNPYLNIVNLDPKGNYLLEWLVDWENSRIIFSTTVKTRGYIGLGLSKRQQMSGADIVIGGVYPNGKPYFNDYHGVANKAPIKDAQQDWTLHSGWENATHTFLSFSRPFDTCDDKDDLLINDNSIAIIWSYGETDNEMEYHHANRGTIIRYLRDPDLTPRGVHLYQPTYLNPNGSVQVWTLSGTDVIPAKDTTYTCTLFKVPTEKKNHIIGFNTILPTDTELRHIHHFVLYHCNVPMEQNPDEIFQPAKGLTEECYIVSEPFGQIPTQYCQEIQFVRGPGQPPFFLPEHVGVPISEFEGRSDYYILQMHYDNPNKIPDIRVNYALEIFITDKLREMDAGVLTFGKAFPASPGILVPPSSLGHSIYGHCGSACTKSIIPEKGLRAVAIKLHSHFAGRKMRLSQIRNNREMEYVMNDDNYFPTYQKIRVLQKERIIHGGDQLIQNCVYENTDRNGSVTVGGFGGRQEMCVGIMYYYNRVVNRAICGSELRSPVYREFLKIYNTTWSNDVLEMIVTEPTENAGLTVSEVGNTRIEWSLKKRRQIQRLHRYLPQITGCPTNVPETETGSGWSREKDSSSSSSSEVEYEKSSIEDEEEDKPHLSSGENQKDLQSTYEYENEILFPGSEFISVYDKNVKSYVAPPRHCSKPKP